MKTLCSACGKTFGGTIAFDMHRTSKFINRHPDYGRRCLTAEELLTKNMIYKNDVWHTPIKSKPFRT